MVDIAAITFQERSALQEGFGPDIDWIKPDAITHTDLNRYKQIWILGNRHPEGKGSELSLKQMEALWSYVNQGGLLYAELIEAWNFQASRLFGWKQEYPWMTRTAERLRVDDDGPRKGQLLEWAGPYGKGFRIYGESWLTIGHYTSTREAGPGEGSMEVPGLVVHNKGLGKVVYAAFPLLQTEQPWARRPFAEWTELYRRLENQTGLAMPELKPYIELAGNQTMDDAVERVKDWFVRSGIMPAADGSLGVYENVHSISAVIQEDRRPDCHAHAALFFHLYGKSTGETKWAKVGHQLLLHILNGGYQDLDPDSATCGFFKWYDFPGGQPDQIFTDDNAWVCFILLYLYRQTGEPIYQKRGMLTARALLETQQSDGLRANCLMGKELREQGRAKGAYSREASGNPHFESIAHAAFIQAYLVSQEREYLDTALKGSLTLLRRMDRLNLMYSRTSGLSRLLLPLAYLERHDDTGEIRRGLDRILEYLRQHRHPCGAIEEADNPDPDKYMKEDTGVFRYNGEGIADLLYTNNFLAMNLWEGWKQTGREAFRELAAQVSAFLSSVQIRSCDSRFDGGWMRAFDLERREYFGNNGDTGWGPYCMESGWTEALIGAGLLLQRLDASLFDKEEVD
ncbi:hypothetical protein ACTHSJ_33325 [Paenibacillus cellulositrophicus]|uniref:hypothetical protein n=1 Tax=Paenibacillus cellulositrophicus TaxID=562959 RepID=UPI003F7E83B1